MGGVSQTQGLASVGGLPGSRPLGNFLPSSSCVGGPRVNRLPLGGRLHAGSQASLVLSMASFFPGLPPLTSASSPILRVYWSLHLAPPPHAVLSLPIGMSTVGNLGFLGSSLGLPLPLAASSPPQLHHPDPNENILPPPHPLPLRS
jgi:hypothetical protein